MCMSCFYVHDGIKIKFEENIDDFFVLYKKWVYKIESVNWSSIGFYDWKVLNTT
jgi:hypothetical protein